MLKILSVANLPFVGWHISRRKEKYPIYKTILPICEAAKTPSDFMGSKQAYTQK